MCKTLVFSAIQPHNEMAVRHIGVVPLNDDLRELLLKGMELDRIMRLAGVDGFELALDEIEQTVEFFDEDDLADTEIGEMTAEDLFSIYLVDKQFKAELYRSAPILETSRVFARFYEGKVMFWAYFNKGAAVMEGEPISVTWLLGIDDIRSDDLCAVNPREYVLELDGSRSESAMDSDRDYMVSNSEICLALLAALDPDGDCR